MIVTIVSDAEGAEAFSELIQSVAAKALAFCGAKIDASVELLIVCDEEIAQINGRTRGIQRPTDVLSFPMIDWKAPADKDVWRFLDLSMEKDPETGKVLLGDIVISIDTARRQAQEFGHGLMRETAFLFLHGMLHLLGYDHQNSEQEDAMRAAQRQILDSLGVTRED